VKLFSEKVSYTSTNSPLNILQVEDYNEIFFGVYEIEINKIKYPVEKISEHQGAPVVSVPVIVDGTEKHYPFLLSKGKFEVFFNKRSDPTDQNETQRIVESSSDISLLEDFIDLDSVEEEALLIPDHADIIAEKIKEAKEAAKELFEQSNKRREKLAEIEATKSKEALSDMLKETRDSLIDEFVKFSNSLKEEILQEKDESLDQRADNIKDTLKLTLENDFATAVEDFDKSIKDLADSYFIKIEPVIDNKIKVLEENINKKIDTAHDSIDEAFDIISSEQVNLNSKLNSGVNKALSRIGNTSTRLDESVKALTDKIDNSIEDVKQIISEKVSLLKETTLTLQDKDILISAIESTRNNLLEEINKFKSQKIISEQTQESDTSTKSLKKLESKLNEKIQAEILHLKKYVASYSGGGGSVAVQYADGGVMRGDLTIEGDITAQSINISSDQFSDYSQQGIYKAQLTSGSNSVETFPIRISPSLSNAKLFISFISPTKKTAVEAFVMHMDTSCFINVYSVIHSDNISPLLLDVSCNTDNNFLNVVTNVTEDCVIIISGFATYADDTSGLLFIP